jgi:hypothetical protein
MASGHLAKAFGGVDLPLYVLPSSAGFYLGTFDEGPYSRESVEYFPSWDAAEDALKNGTWTQRTEP